MQKSDNVYWVLEVEIKQGKFDDFKLLMNEMIGGTKSNEPDTLNYEWCISEDFKNCHIYERYKDSKATMKHIYSFAQQFSDRFMDVVNVKGLVVYGNPDDEVKEALSGFGAVFMRPTGGFTR